MSMSDVILGSIAYRLGIRAAFLGSWLQIHKVKAHHPGAVLLLRLTTDDRAARCPLGVKYGALMCEVENLLCVAAQLHVPVAGSNSVSLFSSLPLLWGKHN
jgi:diaminopimelate decarboxylase